MSGNDEYIVSDIMNYWYSGLFRSWVHLKLGLEFNSNHYSLLHYLQSEISFYSEPSYLFSYIVLSPALLMNIVHR